MIISDTSVRPWRIEWSGYAWTDADADLTAGDVCRLQVLVGDGWASVNPWASPLHLVSMISVLAAKATGADPLEVLALVQATPAEVFVGAIQPRPVT